MSLRIVREPAQIWNLHAHSKFSAKDAMPSVKDMVKTVSRYGQQALGLTDHGNMAGAVQLYQECKKVGIKPFPGIELYTVLDRADKKAKRHHMGVVAFTTEGYRNLVNLSTLSNKNFHNKPLLDHNDMAQLAEDGRLKGIAALSGCRSGFIASMLIDENPGGAEIFAQTYASWFDRFYIEVMNHNIVWDRPGLKGRDGEAAVITDDQLGDALWDIATRLGMPMVLTQDSHYCGIEDREDHDNLKRLVSFGPDPDDAVFSGDGYALATDSYLLDHHHEARFRAGVEGLQDLLGAHDLSIPQLDSYAYNIPFTVDDPLEEIKSRCGAELSARGLSRKHQDRLDDEIDIIEATGMAGYLILVAEVTDWCRLNSVFYQARGSAAGSMVCWLLGITPVDPLKWELGFERFISRDRTKPPDIDLDVEHTRRADLINWLGDRFSIAQIGNWRENKINSTEIDPETGEPIGKGSLRVAYFGMKSRMGEPVGDWDEVPREEKEALHRLDKLKTFSGYGKHAAGIILTTTQDELDDLVPMMWIASSKSMVSQYAMKEIEDLGLVKLDVLGLKTLSVLHKAHDNLGKPVDLDWIPMTDSKTFQNFAKGQTDGVFQLEGYASRRGVKDLKPTKVADIVAAMALFRPAVMNSGATRQYIKTKHGEMKPPERHELLMEVTKQTNGILLFQEQVITILRSFGMDPDHLTKFLKLVKASQQDEMIEAAIEIERQRAEIEVLAADSGVLGEDWDWLWDAITGFAAYGFNRAHSTVYGLTAYRTGYLAANHTIEYFAALLNIAAGSEKEPIYAKATRNLGIRLSQPLVNESGISYEVAPNRKSIRKGLTSIKGVGSVAAKAIVTARAEQPFVDLQDFADRVNHTKVNGILPFRDTRDTGVGVFGKLFEADAFDGLIK